MEKSTKKFITTLRKSFRETDAPGRYEIWHILTALRGPDTSPAFREKDATTAVIRQTLFGNKLCEDIPADTAKDSKESVLFRTKGDFQSGHFREHAEQAFYALGLKWNDVNN